MKTRKKKVEFPIDQLAASKSEIYYLVVANISARDAIPDKKEGMLVYVLDISESYRYTNLTWVQQIESFPIASSSVLGGIRVGSKLTINPSTGELSVSYTDQVTQNGEALVTSGGVYNYVENTIVGPILNNLTNI